MLGRDDDAEPEDALARWQRRVHEADAPALRVALSALDQPARAVEQLELRLLDATSTWRWFDVRLRVVERAAGGAALRIIVTLQDVGERRGAEERQRLSASLLHNLHEGLLVTDTQYRVIDLNPAYTAITGITRDELLGCVPAMLQPATPETPAHERQAAMWASLQQTGAWRGEVVERRRNGDPCTLQVTISTVRDARGAPRHLVLVLTDVTEQRLHREALERQAHFDELTRPAEPHAPAQAADRSDGGERTRRLPARRLLHRPRSLQARQRPLRHGRRRPPAGRPGEPAACGAAQRRPLGRFGRAPRRRRVRAAAARALAGRGAAGDRPRAARHRAAVHHRCGAGAGAGDRERGRHRLPARPLAMPKRCCATPTMRCTAPSRPAATATCSSTPS